MKNSSPETVIGIPIGSAEVEGSSRGYVSESAGEYHIPSPANEPPTSNQCRAGALLNMMNKLAKRADNLAHGVREHVRLGPKITGTVKGKLSLGARILQVGGVDNIFKQLFRVKEGEKLFKAAQCYISTTAGPIAGLLFISTEKVAFCSERPIKISGPKGELIKAHYKVMIPLKKIKRVKQSADLKKPSQKYIEILTEDDFDFWFMGFLNYQKALKFLQQAISQA
ncbi:GEM-like protein 4 [Morella rubra]|uniref:GEM-like protein 4 n=1 Tax=Morella rubra TaxID=262757 RepID=A0A6A1V5D3_9ROSI|nr:GEM-like protein 4 [Morella rubra]KAB1206451.1 GEM-like protein 4 [Morella rubra]